jgi:hypothetical protein
VTDQPGTGADVPDVRKSVRVPASVDVAFRVFTQRPAEWLPAGHTFLKNPGPGETLERYAEAVARHAAA